METKNQINTVAGTATFVKTLNDKELDAGDYSTRNGYWVIHRGANHDVYKVKMAEKKDCNNCGNEHEGSRDYKLGPNLEPCNYCLRRWQEHYWKPKLVNKTEDI